MASVKVRPHRTVSREAIGRQYRLCTPHAGILIGPRLRTPAAVPLSRRATCIGEGRCARPLQSIEHEMVIVHGAICSGRKPAEQCRQLIRSEARISCGIHFIPDDVTCHPHAGAQVDGAVARDLEIAESLKNAAAHKNVLVAVGQVDFSPVSKRVVRIIGHYTATRWPRVLSVEKLWA